MPSVVALRIVIGASLGLGALDVVWINMALAPEAIAPDSPPQVMSVVRIDVPSPAPRVGEAGVGASPVDTPRAAIAARAVDEPPADITPHVDTHAVYFATLSASLDDKARTELEELAASLPTDAAVVLEGHADHRGDESLNDRLSRDRASAVARELVRLGISRDRLRVRHVGEALASDLGEVWRDRRVDIQITGGTR